MNAELQIEILEKLESAKGADQLASILGAALNNHHGIGSYALVFSGEGNLKTLSGTHTDLDAVTKNRILSMDSQTLFSKENNQCLINLGLYKEIRLFLIYNSPLVPEDDTFHELNLLCRLWYSFYDKAQTTLKLAKTSEQISTIKNIGLEISRDSDNQAILSNILKSIIATAKAEKGFIMLYDDTTQLLKLEVVHGLPNPKAEEMINKGLLSTDGIKPGEGIQGKVFLIKKAMKINEASEFSSGGTPGDQAIICVPLCINDQAFGVVYVTNKIDDGEFDEFDLDLVTILANNVATLIYQAKLMKASITDPLTGMFTRRHFEIKLKHEIKRSVRYDRSLSVLALDIDFFKKVNDTYGHPAGDEVLKNVATIINQTIRNGIDLAARFGGEEFFIYLPESNLEGAQILADRIRDSVENLKTQYDGQQIRATVSIGISQLPNHAEGYDLLLSRSDEALYTSKTTGRNRVTTWEKKETFIQ